MYRPLSVVALLGTVLSSSTFLACRYDMQLTLYVGQTLGFPQSTTWSAHAVTTLFRTAQVMAKIEKPQAVNDLEEIVALCDAIMVARCVPHAAMLMVPSDREYALNLNLPHVVRLDAVGHSWTEAGLYAKATPVLLGLSFLEMWVGAQGLILASNLM